MLKSICGLILHHSPICHIRVCTDEVWVDTSHMAPSGHVRMLHPDDLFTFLVITHMAPSAKCATCVMSNFEKFTPHTNIVFSGMRRWCAHMPDDHSSPITHQDDRFEYAPTVPHVIRPLTPHGAPSVLACFVQYAR